MSLNKTLDRLFDEIRREAKRNPDFANRMDAVLRSHESRRDVAEGVMEEVATPRGPPASSRQAPKPSGVVSAGKMPAVQVADKAAVDTPELNPVGLYQREGQEALVAALDALGLPALQALVAEHNLDPSGATADFDRDALVAHVLAQAKRRAERDATMFDY